MEDENIECSNCKNIFPRKSDYRHCSNCFVCTGCEIYYCPWCDERIVIRPMRKMTEN